MKNKMKNKMRRPPVLDADYFVDELMKIQVSLFGNSFTIFNPNPTLNSLWLKYLKENNILLERDRK